LWARFTPGELGDNPFLALAAALKPGWARPADLANELAAQPEKLCDLSIPSPIRMN